MKLTEELILSREEFTRERINWRMLIVSAPKDKIEKIEQFIKSENIREYEIKK